MRSRLVFDAIRVVQAGILSALLLTGPVLAQPPDHVKLPLYGHWRLVGASVAVPVQCRHSELHISAEGFVQEHSYSARGELFSFRSSIRVQQQGSHFLLHLGVPQHNGLPDCLGNSANYIADNFLTMMHLQIHGDRLYNYFSGDPDQGYLRYQRMAE
jgi:hypothetical protein